MNSKSFWLIASGAWLMLAAGVSRADTLFSDVTYEGLVTDPRSTRVGQILTVLIYEQASAATSADRETSSSVGFFANVRGNSAVNRGQFDGGTDTDGGGTISRSGRLVASVSVSIDEVLPSGEIHVSGEQRIEFNEESQYIRVAGRVRPEDIAADNTVISTRLANAEISYVGDGLLGRQQRPGFLTRIFNKLF